MSSTASAVVKYNAIVVYKMQQRKTRRAQERRKAKNEQK